MRHTQRAASSLSTSSHLDSPIRILEKRLPICGALIASRKNTECLRVVSNSLDGVVDSSASIAQEEEADKDAHCKDRRPVECSKEGKWGERCEGSSLMRSAVGVHKSEAGDGKGCEGH